MCGAAVCSAAAAGSRLKSDSNSLTLHPPPGYSPFSGVSPALPGALLSLTGPVDASYPVMASHSLLAPAFCPPCATHLKMWLGSPPLCPQALLECVALLRGKKQTNKKTPVSFCRSQASPSRTPQLAVWSQIVTAPFFPLLLPHPSSCSFCCSCWCLRAGLPVDIRQPQVPVLRDFLSFAFGGASRWSV